MDKKTRVEKYKKLREEIDDMDTYKFDSPFQVNEEKDDIAMSNDELQEQHIKKNTLSISIDQIVKAHDEYTTMISKEELKKQEKNANKVQNKKLLITIGIIGGIVILLAIIVVLLVLLFNK